MPMSVETCNNIFQQAQMLCTPMAIQSMLQEGFASSDFSRSKTLYATYPKTISDDHRMSLKTYSNIVKRLNWTVNTTFELGYAVNPHRIITSQVIISYDYNGPLDKHELMTNYSVMIVSTHYKDIVERLANSLIKELNAYYDDPMESTSEFQIPIAPKPSHADDRVDIIPNMIQIMNRIGEIPSPMPSDLSSKINPNHIREIAASLGKK